MVVVFYVCLVYILEQSTDSVFKFDGDLIHVTVLIIKHRDKMNIASFSN